MDKIPDIVKTIRNFSGQPGEFGSWKKSVDRILKIYEHMKGTPKYYSILTAIRNKITGNADISLESNNTPLKWEQISKCLVLHYADKRDIGTLEYQMTTLIQKNLSILEFYQKVYHHLSLILNKLSSMEMSEESLHVLTQTYRDKALDTFIRGLKGDLPRLLSMREPGDLPEALHLCLKLENVDYRIQHSHGNFKRTTQDSPPIPQKRDYYYQQNRFQNNLSNFYPELLRNTQIPPRPNFSNFSKPLQNPYLYQGYRQYNNPFQPQKNQFYNQNQHYKHQQNNNTPQPMEIDQSIRSRAVNYQNRPRIQHLANKRPASQQIYQDNKFQRVNYREQSDNNTITI